MRLVRRPARGICRPDGGGGVRRARAGAGCALADCSLFCVLAAAAPASAFLCRRILQYYNRASNVRGYPSPTLPSRPLSLCPPRRRALSDGRRRPPLALPSPTLRLLAQLDDPCGSIDPGMLSRYITSVYWAATTIATVGYGDVVPTTDAERGYVVMCLFIGASFFSFIVGSVCGVIAQLMERETIFEAQMTQLNAFIRAAKLHGDLPTRLRAFFRYQARRAVWWRGEAVFYFAAPRRAALFEPRGG